ncbi:BTAD domain-containing putative transcriptional regulator [Micromonospora cathayae]|uniref:BTAD domain-containing putative transcriptional regulator n=1 Tax=Micromonospora cathayae TaxID=3028804 RepID=A0ABY7ZLE7_9ACTN|nr:BTAD domain-containing putative transcriptional regulator [Micromonospora sp. HUAS 3]WDZ83730.1 BTAD domain-containing putative transcriptional regulator [Micromonospora sp. HUAS 3]
MVTSPDGWLRVSVLGPVRAWRDGRELALGPARQRVLFALLAAAVGREVGRDELVAGIWGPSPPTTAVGSVYTYVSGLRRSLGAGSVASGPSGYALRLRGQDLDSERFVVLCAEAARLRTAGEPAAAVARLDEALGLWHGEAYAGLASGRLDGERVRLAERRLDALVQRAGILIGLGDGDVTVELAGLVREHPLHEPLYELLMLALHRDGRRREALDVYRTARHTLRSELGIEPGSALTRMRGLVAAGPAGTHGGRSTPARVAGTAVPGRPDVPGRVTEAAVAGRDGPPTESLAGRDDGVRRLRDLVGALRAGAGTVVWVEGEPGIGKTVLLRAAFADAAERGCRVAWGVAGDFDQDLPLPVAMRALGLAADAGTAPAARWTDAGTGPAAGWTDTGTAPATGWTDAGTGPGAADLVLARVRAACASTPLVLVLDGLDSADGDGVSCWERLVAATRRLPLLLVASARLEPGDRDLARLRRAVRTRQGHLLQVEALPSDAVERMVAGLVGAPPGPHLAEAVAVAAGNPRYAHELVTALLRRGVVRVVDGVADIPDPTPIEVPRPLLATIRATMDLLSADTQDVLRTAALLGDRFAVDDVGAVTGRPAGDLVANLEEALAARVVVAAGTELAFRHTLLRQVLYESIPAPARSALHRHTAEVLAAGDSPVDRVAEQLAATSTVDGWLVSWLVDRHAELAGRAPRLATALLRRVLDTDLPDRRQRERLLITLVRLEHRSGRRPLDEAREALQLADDPADRAELRHLLAVLSHQAGDVATALDVLDAALADPTVPAFWRTRHRMLLAAFRRGPLDDLDRADRTAAAAHATALAANRPDEAAFALQTGWLTNTVRRDHERALEYVDRALDVMRDHPTFAALYLDLLDNRTGTLQSLDRLADAERTLREAALFALRHRLPSGLHAASAVQHYWAGRWDDVLSVVGAVSDDQPGATLLGAREPGAVAMLLHGTAALVAARRDDAVLAGGHLAAPEPVPATDAERASGDFLLVARAMLAEQQGHGEQALRVLEPLLVPGYAPLLLRHQWLPDVVRLALEVGRRDVAERAAAGCADEAAREVRAARAHWAAARCRALLTADPEPALAAAAHYRAVGRVTELAGTLEDAAVLLAADRRPHDAARAGTEATELFAVLGARWDLRRAYRRLAGYGIGLDVDPVAEDRGAQRTSISHRE